MFHRAINYLGSLLFTLYTADLPNYVALCNAHLYADDCQLHLFYGLNSHNSNIEMVNIDLKSMRKWFTEHDLQLNTDKCSVLRVATLQRLLSLHEDDVQVVLDGGR